MGRKIPGRKHRGIRDPEKQREIRLQKLQGKVDAPPSDPDYQEIPQSLNRIIELKEIAKNSKRKPKKKKNQFLLERERGETERDYLHRVDAYCDEIIQENAFQNKHKVDVKRNIDTGEIEDVVKREDDEFEESVKKKKKEIKLKKRQRLGDKGPTIRLTKSQKRQKKLTEKKEKRILEKRLDNHVVKDHVKFGEVVHAPPTLSMPRRASKIDGAARPGQKSLLLKSMFGDNSKQKNHDLKDGYKRKDNLNKTTHKVIDKKGKRKNLPNALRRKIEDQQMEMIKAYRKIKQQKATKRT
ncbi:hypothetical protein RN001_014310 [Aquatica leii]|uniref:Coiled-coil domain-containing protein 137 n=1 Tax=Aquatica leii TaxID=1421715 RepID=A0AAN7SP24_9COLE|nr:hypothetical protein RN001_014310 [Aquatica leii]